MNGSDWKHPHIVLLLGATALAFGGGYAFGTRRAQPSVATSPVIITNELTTAPPTRARPDENTLIAENAERDEAVANRSQPERPDRAERPERAEPRPPARDTRGDPDGDEVDPDAVDPGTVGEKPQG